MTDEGLCASGKMGLCIKCPDCMSTTTEFKVGDQVRHKEFPSLVGEVYEVTRWSVYFKRDDGVEVGYPLEEVEHVHATEEDWEDAAWDLAEDDAWASAAERAELKGWAKGVSDMDKAGKDPWVPTEHGALVDAMRELLESWLDTFDKKQRAYGPKAIANAPLGAAEGLLNRIHDKYSRLVQLMQNPDVDDLGEATADTVKDMGIYCAMLVLVNEGKWPGV